MKNLTKIVSRNKSFRYTAKPYLNFLVKKLKSEKGLNLRALILFYNFRKGNIYF